MKFNYMHTSESERLRCLTAKFVSMQGLRQVLLGVLLLLARPVLCWGFDAPLAVIVSLLLILAFLGVMSWLAIGRYYERRFGSVEVGRKLWTGLDGISLLRRGLFGSGVLLAFLVSMKLFRGRFDPVAALMSAIFFLFFGVDRRPWYYLIFTAAFFMLAVSGDRGSLIQVESWLFPIALILTGIFDHRALASSLPGLRRDDV